ncbi:chemotaxis protein [Ahniella affigens]|uniref:Chemotaxis protein n=1 Tax=Ahniella affigens TaxID=2021234 RepID=A0A2P1PTP6_9GAMM|nr:methyl-accepting chemotaxis protein [Ahniella affigens]AVP98216.1 chemotaxis protein [Ahniella affigens]
MSATSGGASRFSGPLLWGAVALVFLGLLGANLAYQAILDRQERNAIRLTTDLQVLSQQISKFATEAASGNLEAFEELKATRVNIQDSIDALSKGSEKEGVPSYAADTVIGPPLKRVEQAWMPIAKSADTINGASELVLNIADEADAFSDNIPRMSSKMDELVLVLLDDNAPGDTVYLATRQILLADRMLRRVSDIRKGGEDAVSAADQFVRDARVFGQVLDGLTDGDTEVGIRALTDPKAREILADIQDLYSGIRESVGTIQEASTDLFEVTEAKDKIFLGSTDLLDKNKSLAASFGNKVRMLGGNILNVVLGALALFAALIAGMLQYLATRKQLQSTADLNSRNQEAILRLLDEMGSLAEGDLTVKATVTEDITGAIADSVNFAVEALRSLVATINETAVQVAAAAQETQATAMHLAEAAEHQAQQITSASAAINEIAVSIDEVSKNSAESADVAQRSVAIAGKGAAIVRQTIQGMDNIRDQIQETSKRIKRLGESSQEIGSIVELINDIADQTNILALNAAIQAASAGEAGRGFAVVADEVQRLAERASGATKRIETLVQTIQSDTNEAVSSMEQTTSEVVAGARLAEDAGLALGEIEKVSNDLADLIQNISEAARQQSAAATNISATMNVIQEITTQTSAGASQTAESIGNLAQLAADLRRSVADFKLPS